MGVVIKWKIPDTDEVTYDYAYIYRATSQGGTYSNIANQLIADYTYFDIDGGASNWYKIRFFESSSGTWSAYSEPLQGGKWYGYCSPDDVRKLVGLTTTDITDSNMYDVITFATVQLNHEINSKIVEESVKYIDATRDNDIDGSNTTYYVQNSFDWYLADMNDDGVVDGDDVVVYQYASDGTKTEPSISSVTANEGKIVLSSAPASGVTLKITYSYGPVSESDPHPLLRQACAYLAGAMASLKLERNDFQKLTLGKLTVARFRRPERSAFNRYYDAYQRILRYLKSKSIRKVHDEKSAWFGVGLDTKKIIR